MKSVRYRRLTLNETAVWSFLPFLRWCWWNNSRESSLLFTLKDRIHPSPKAFCCLEEGSSRIPLQQMLLGYSSHITHHSTSASLKNNAIWSDLLDCLWASPVKINLSWIIFLIYQDLWENGCGESEWTRERLCVSSTPPISKERAALNWKFLWAK